MSLSITDTRMSSLCPSNPTLTEKNLDDQAGKVFIVTGGTGGLGQELTSILYQKNAKVYVTVRSEDKAKTLIQELEKKHPTSIGDVIPIKLQLDDLTTIKTAADEFLAKEQRLDVLWCNAGVMVPPAGSKTKQGHELQLGINNIGHHLFLHFLTPLLKETAKSAPHDSVRVVWVSSSAADGAPHPAIDFSNMDYGKAEGDWVKYARSKGGNVIQAAEFARRAEGSGIISLALNPGNFVTNLQDNMPKMQLAMFRLISSEPIKGAYTELFAGLDKSITSKNNGGWVSPFGKIEPSRKDLVDPQLGKQYWEWLDAQTKAYM